MGIPPIGPQSVDASGMTPFKESTLNDERLTKVVNDGLQAAWNISPEKRLKVEESIRPLFDKATHSLMEDISLLLRERVQDENKQPNVACEELGRIASQKAAEEGLHLHSFFSELKDSKAQQELIKLLLVTDLLEELGLQLDEKEVTKIDEAFKWAIDSVEDREKVSSDSQILNDAIRTGENSLVDLLTVGYPLAAKN